MSMLIRVLMKQHLRCPENKNDANVHSSITPQLKEPSRNVPYVGHHAILPLPLRSDPTQATLLHTTQHIDAQQGMNWFYWEALEQRGWQSEFPIKCIQNTLRL